MDTNSPLEAMNGFIKEDGASQVDKMDLNVCETKEESGVDGVVYESQMPHEEMQFHSNNDYASPPIISCEVNEMEKHFEMVSTLADSSLPVIEFQKENKEGNLYEEHEHDDGAITTVIVDIEDSIQHHKNSLDRGDNDDCDSTYRQYYDKQSTNTSSPEKETNYNCDQVVVDTQLEVNEVDTKMDDKHFIKPYHQSQMRLGDYPYDVEMPNNVRTVQENSSLHSSQGTQNISVPQRQLSVYAEQSPRNSSLAKSHTSPERQPSLSPSAPSPLSSSRRHSPSPQKPSLGDKRASSRDQSSPLRTPKSPHERESKRETNKVYSPRRHRSRSPRKHGSPRRRTRSKSKSPTRRRNSPGNQRGHRHSRSRSPHARSQNRRLPRRQSPRRRSPQSYHSRHPTRRPYSPSNRNTGIGRPGNNLFIAGFSYLTTERDLKRKFSEFGRVTDVRVVRDRRSGDSRGFGFLSLERDEDADAAIRAVDQSKWNGRVVLVEKSKTTTR